MIILIILSPVASSRAETLQLDPELRAFLDQHPVIRVRLQDDWPPLIFQDEAGARGLSVDYMTLAAAKLGLTIETSAVKTFPEVMKRLPTGDGIDVQPTMRATDQRRQNIHFTRSYTSFPVVIIARNNSGFIGGLDDLVGRVVVAEKSYWYTEEIRLRHPALHLKTVDTSAEAIRAVAQGDADAYVGVLPVATWHIENKGYTNLKIAAPSGLAAAELSFGVRGDWPQLAAALDVALANITAEEHRNIRHHWLSAHYDYGIDTWTVVLWGGGGLTIALLLLGSFALANRRLLREITLRRQAEEELRTTEETSRQLLDASSDACMLFDADGTMRACNQVFASRFGIDSSQVTGTNLWDYFPTDVSDERRIAVAGVVMAGKPVVTSDVRNGRYLSNSIYPLKDNAGIVRRIAVYSRDISEQVWAEQKIKSYVAEIERSNEDLEQFAYVASHDLREPLRQVASYVALLDRRYGPQLDDDARQFIAYAREGVTRMDQLILDLLEYSRIGRGQALAPMESAPAAQIAIDNLKAVLVDCGGSVTLQSPLPRVLASEPQLIRLFQNLIGNGLKYHRAGTPPLITISATTDDTFATFAIADNGIGIESEYFERIFGIFQRLHIRTQYPGTGIGLAVCRKVVERHEGHIWVESTPGEGSCFYFSLKLPE
ncbi:ATP-binding protein [Magnetospirillum sulfuroxidans]|uniref:histidine kinase n=1 Tax=Magnetospirillum sulfuroxidans TaxID=611300 RepID=A0ABS5IIE2_9PROT|nr:transporter substrate-binding domain-containing protein [Magnetospirillum sulfuroxidans]MBR9973538.1 transporter substrate-binding domain-containing protein [Magnetospirillum sulfuroxidans]